MGIDIYATWKGQTNEEAKAQVTGFSVVHGHTGYLREAYHGEPYATRHLCTEAFESPTHKAPIPAATLKRRLPGTIGVVRKREKEVYGETDEREIKKVVQSFIDFVALCERKEQETGEPVTITASF